MDPRGPLIRDLLLLPGAAARFVSVHSGDGGGCDGCGVWAHSDAAVPQLEGSCRNH